MKVLRLAGMSVALAGGCLLFAGCSNGESGPMTNPAPTTPPAAQPGGASPAASTGGAGELPPPPGWKPGGGK